MLDRFTRMLRLVRFPGKRIWVVLLLFVSAMGSADAQTWSWKFELVDKSAKFTSIGVDRNGGVHVSYTDDSSHVLRYAFRSAESSHWFTLELDKNLQNVTTTHLTLDSQGNPHICYPTWSTLKYAHWSGERWMIQEISPGGAKEYTCSLAISVDGSPFVSWYQVRGPDNSFYYHIRTAALQDGAWFARTIDFEGEAGKWNSTVVDKNGLPWVSYSTFPSGELKIAHWDGKDWQRNFIDPMSRDKEKVVRGMGNSLRIGPEGKLHISYFGDRDLRYAVLEDDHWVVQKVDEITPLGSWVGYLSSLDFDHASHPHISYDDGRALKHAYWDGKTWHVQIVASSGGDPYRYSSLGVAPDDTIYISYRDSQDGSLKVAVGRPTTTSVPTAILTPLVKKD